MGQWLITVSAASVLMTVLDNLAGEGKAGRTASFVMGVIGMAISLRAAVSWLGG